MKRIFIETKRLQSIVELYVVCNDPSLANTKTTDGKEMDIRVYIDEQGAHIMIPNIPSSEHLTAITIDMRRINNYGTQ